MFKRFLAVFFVLVITASFGVISVAAEDSPTFTVSDASANAGDDIEVTLTCEGNPGITAWKLDVSYDRDVMQLTDCNIGGTFDGVMTSKSVDAYPYTLSWSNDLADDTSNGTIAVLKFHIKENAASGKYNVELSYDPDNVYSVVLDDSGMETNVHFETKTGVVTIAGSLQNGIYGDIDGDEDITSADALSILRISAGLDDISEELFVIADVDGDEDITSADALAVLRCSAGMSDNENIGNPIE